MSDLSLHNPLNFHIHRADDIPDFKEKMFSLVDEYIVKNPWHEIVSRTNDGEFENPEITLVQVLSLQI